MIWEVDEDCDGMMIGRTFAAVCALQAGQRQDASLSDSST